MRRLAGATTIGGAAAGRVLDLSSPPIASTNPSRRRGRARRPRRRPASPRRWNGSKTGSRSVARDARAVVDDAHVDAAVDRAGLDAHGRSGGEKLTALSTRFASARSSRPDRRARAGASRARRRRRVPSRGAEAASAAGTHLVEADACAHDVERAGLQPAHVEQVADERVRGGRSPRRSSRGTRAAPRASSRRRPGAGSSTDALIAASGVRRSCGDGRAGAPCAARSRPRARRPPRPRPRARRARPTPASSRGERVSTRRSSAPSSAPPAARARRRRRASTDVARPRGAVGTLVAARAPRLASRPRRGAGPRRRRAPNAPAGSSSSGPATGDAPARRGERLGLGRARRASAARRAAARRSR